MSSRWKYVFCDLATGRELATLPMTGVSFEQKLLDIGVLEGVVPTTDPAVRALDPWSATRERRTAVFVECDDDTVWGGIVWGATRDQTTNGIKISAATFESWLNYAFIRRDLNFVGLQLGAPSTFKVLVEEASSYDGANIGITVDSNQYPWTIGQGGDGTGENTVAGQVFHASDLKPLQDALVNWVKLWGVPIEWRMDVTRKAGGGYTITLLVTENSLADERDQVLLRYGTSEAANLLTFTDAVDGTQHPSGIVAAAGSVTGAQQTPITLFTWTTADTVGVPELASGYPLLQAAYSVPSGTTITSQSFLSQGDLGVLAEGEMLDRLAQGNTISNLTVRPDSPPLGSYAVGDPCRLEITHVAYQEWPQPAVYDPWRITGRKVTVGEGTNPDQVELTIVPAGDRIPNARTVPAELRRMASRIRMMEVRAGL